MTQPCPEGPGEKFFETLKKTVGRQLGQSGQNITDLIIQNAELMARVEILSQKQIIIEPRRRELSNTYSETALLKDLSQQKELNHLLKQNLQEHEEAMREQQARSTQKVRDLTSLVDDLQAQVNFSDEVVASPVAESRSPEPECRPQNPRNFATKSSQTTADLRMNKGADDEEESNNRQRVDKVWRDLEAWGITNEASWVEGLNLDFGRFASIQADLGEAADKL